MNGLIVRQKGLILRYCAKHLFLCHIFVTLIGIIGYMQFFIEEGYYPASLDFCKALWAIDLVYLVGFCLYNRISFSINIFDIICSCLFTVCNMSLEFATIELNKENLLSNKVVGLILAQCVVFVVFYITSNIIEKQMNKKIKVKFNDDI